jgi:ABC-type uncharacterized transport system ATPase subunit
MSFQELEIDGLRRSYGTVTALDGLTFGVPAGQVFGFLGPNGDANSILRTGPRISIRQAIRESRKA